MPKSENQKLKLLYLLDYLRENSNSEHYVTRHQLENYFSSLGIKIERKTIYDDVEKLNEYGENIVVVPGKNGGYYYDGGKFELPELKMLVDSVQSSKFITEEQSFNLIEKLEKLTDKFDANQLHRQVVVADRVKTKQNNIFSNIDHISNAINENKKIRFKYMQYNMQKELKCKNNGDEYFVSPLSLFWDNENYYLIAFDSVIGITKHFRVDKMKSIYSTDEKREGVEKLSPSVLSSYGKRVFGMFGGEEKEVTMRFNKHLIGVVIDRFGKDIIIIPSKDGQTFTVTLKICISSQFYAWLCGFCGECEVLAPDEVRNALRDIGNKLTDLYK